MEVEKLGLKDLNLMDGESLYAALNLKDEGGERQEEDPDVILLTGQRVIHINPNGQLRRAVFVPLQNIDVVEITRKRSYGGFIWGALAFFVAIMLWQVWDYPIGSTIAVATVALMGAYLVVDQILSPGSLHVSFKAGPSRLQCGIMSNHESKDIHTFVNRLFELKAEATKVEPHRRRDFSPR